MSTRKAVPLALAALLMGAAAAPAQRPDNDMPDLAKGYKWQDAARKHKLNAKDVETLAKQKVLMTNEAFKQVFDPYIKAKGMPLFITSDSLLNAFHVLYEESVLRLEKVNARRLPEILRFVWKGLAAQKPPKGAEEVYDRAWRRARVVVGTAIALLGEKPKGADEEVARLIDGEVRKITAAKPLDPDHMKESKPAWLGTPDRTFTAIDYSRYKPRGFYTKSEALKRYFRAVSWLQSIPFRVEKDEELAAALLLGRAAASERFANGAEYLEFREYFQTFREFVGTRDDWDLLKATEAAGHARRSDGGLEVIRKRLLERARREGEQPMINDLVRFPPADPRVPASEPNFRILSAYRTPDAILFHRTTDLRHFSRGLPSGLEVATALGSAYARARVPGPQRDKVLKVLEETLPLFRGRSLYYDYLDCLRCLLDEPEPDAPAFLKGEPWQAKSCQTALAGWAQLRHTWALQAKQSVTYAGMSFVPPGFVEPEPEFFARMARLVERTRKVLEAAGALKPDWSGLAANLHRAADLAEKRGDPSKGPNGFYDVVRTEKEFRLVSLAIKMLHRSRRDREDDLPQGEAGFRKRLERIRSLARAMERGKVPDTAGMKRVLRERHVALQPLWDTLEEVCRRLETLAHKQLRGQAFGQDDERFIRAYGCRIAGVMLYGGNSYLVPRDDAPRAIDVHYDPNHGRYLEVGVGRPRALYVLYPHKGAEVLCRGAVMPYYEFQHGERLTDTQWKALLDSKHRPDVPAWVKPIVGSGGIGAAKLPED